jgi:uncharacterized iron-regulated membrane protein
MSPAFTRRLLSWHRICGLFVSLNVALFAVTGAYLIFHGEIDRALGVLPEVTSEGESITLARAVEVAKTARPGENLLYVFSDDEEFPNTILVGTAKGSRKLEDSKPVMIDAVKGEEVGKVDFDNTLSAIVFKLHAQLLMGPAGALLVGAIGLAFLFSLVSGFILYGPMMKRFAFGMLRRDRHVRTLMADVHKLVGAVTFGWNLVVVVTGVFLSLGSTLLQYYTMTELAALAAPYKDEAAVTDFSTLDDAVRNAETASGGRRWSLVAMPGSDFASPRHYAVLLKGHEGLDQRMLTMGLVDAKDPKVVDHRLFPWYLRALLISEPLHFGDYGGLPLKLLWLAFTLATLAITITGVWVTFATWRERGLRKRSQPVDDGVSAEAAE